MSNSGIGSQEALSYPGQSAYETEEGLQPQVISLAAYQALKEYKQSNQIDEAYPHQELTFDMVIDFLRSGNKRGYVESPTNSGKTYYISKLAEALAAAGLKVLILAPTITIADQISANPNKGLMKFAKGLQDTDIGRYYGGSKPELDKLVTVMTYRGFVGLSKGGTLPEFDIFLADEAHNSLGRVTKHVLLNESPDAIKIGFTATSRYGLDKAVDEIFETAIHRISIKEAIDEHLIAPVHCLLYATEAEIPNLDYQKDFTAAELRRLIDLHGRNQAAIDLARQFVIDGRQGIISCVPGGNLAHARNLAADLDNMMVDLPDGRKKFIRAAAVGSFQDQKRNAELLLAFENGQIDILTFVSSLGEGWDTSRASFLINACPTTSYVKLTQLIGRVLRIKEDKRHSIIVDFVDYSKRKQQVTAPMVLGDERYNFRKVYGTESGADAPPHTSYIDRLAESYLWQNLIRFNSVLLREVNLKSAHLSEEDRLQRHWERILEGERLPAELPPDTLGMPTSRLQMLGQAARKAVVRRDGTLKQYISSETRQTRNSTYWNLNSRLSWLGYLHEVEKAVEGLEPIPQYGAQPYDNLSIKEAVDRAVADDSFEDRLTEAIDTAVSTSAGLSLLNEREIEVLKSRYGLNGEEEVTLAEIGRKLGISSNRVRQIEYDALRRIVPGVINPHGNKLGNIYNEARQSRINSRLEEIDHQLYLAKLHSIRYSIRAASGIVDQDPSKDQIIYHYNKYGLLRKLYQLAPEATDIAEINETDSKQGLAIAIDNWMPYAADTLAKKAEVVKFISKRINSNADITSLSIARWLRHLIYEASDELFYSE